MALSGKTAAEKIWNFFKKNGLTDYGIAGLMGNLRAESGLNPINMQNSYEKKLNYTDKTYTQAVDNGSYGNFVKDAVGYGLAQWTYWSRKQNLLEYVRSKGKSVGDMECQLEFLYKELSTSYKSVLNVLKKATSVLEASNAVLKDFERPADQSASTQKERAEYGQEYFNEYGEKGGSIMGVIIGSAKINENGKISGGAAGDQTKREVATESWYLHKQGWVVIRAKKAAIAEKIAKNMAAICENDNIGYCQTHRSSLTEASKPYGYDASKVTKKVETDCSEAVRNCVLYAGIKVGSFTTGNEKTILKGTGEFEILTEDKYCGSSDYLRRGDILVTKTKGHTVVVLTNGKNAEREENSGATTPTTPPAAEVKVDSARSKDTSIAGEYEVTASSGLHLRAGAGKSKASIMVMKKGTKVRCYGFYTSISGVKWYLVAAEGKTGFCSSEYLEKC